MAEDLPIPFLPSLLGQRIRQAEDRADRIYEPLVGLVVDNKDPDKLGRVKVRYPTLPGQDTSWWAPIAALGAGKDRGWFFLPEIDDEVLVVFEHGDFRRPVVLGALWNGKDMPPDKNGGGNEKRVLVSRSGSRVELDDDKGTVTIEDGGKNGRIVIDSGSNKITLEALKGDLVLQAPAGELTVVASECDMQAQQGLKIEAGATINLGANTVAVQGARLTVSAGRLDLNPGGVPPPQPASASPEDVPDPV
ncbi:MAG TPA: phage baseplate assembly protein V [Kofleriaceae bacterium]|nr:phage baseplate assembly protein V [Kofleriaceae bacterium]